MDWQLTSFDWNQVRAFQATAEEGSFSGAARVLGLTQPTLGRQISILEDRLGVLLFDRGGRSPVLTASGVELLEYAQNMTQAAGMLSLAASGQSQVIEGEVSLTANELMAAYVLPPVVRRIRMIAPKLEIRLVASDSVRDLTKREADIAIRHVRPDQPELVARLVGRTRAHLYGSEHYLKDCGEPDLRRDSAGLDFLTDEHQERTKRTLTSRGVNLEKAEFRVISNSRVVIWEMIKLGMGVSVMTDDIADGVVGVKQLCPDLVSFDIPVWLTAHRELQTSRKVRLVYDELVRFFLEDQRYRG
jgi:DNA-binding transcriptional LysR family regulator